MDSFHKIINHTFWKDKKMTIAIILAILINATLWFILFQNIKVQVDNIVLHYNTLFGIDLLGEWYQIFILPFVGLLIFIVNTILAYLLFEKTKILSYFLLFASLIIQIFLIIAGWLLVIINS